jgi:hypothetical protein
MDKNKEFWSLCLHVKSTLLLSRGVHDIKALLFEGKTDIISDSQESYHWEGRLGY